MAAAAGRGAKSAASSVVRQGREPCVGWPSPSPARPKTTPRTSPMSCVGGCCLRAAPALDLELDIAACGVREREGVLFKEARACRVLAQAKFKTAQVPALESVERAFFHPFQQARRLRVAGQAEKPI